MVDDLDNSTEPSGIGVVTVDNHHTANLNKAPGGSLDQSFTHFAGGLKKLALVGCSQEKCAQQVSMILGLVSRSRKGRGCVSYQLSLIVGGVVSGLILEDSGISRLFDQVKCD